MAVCSTADAQALPREGLAAAEASPVAASRSSNVALLAEEEADPRWLKQQVHSTMQTNAPPDRATKSMAAPRAKLFNWDASWKGWDGLHLELSRNQQLEDPLAEDRATSQGTNADRVFNLEELKMRGKLGIKYALDAAAFVTSDTFEDFDGGVELRRARLYAKGDCLLVMPVSYQLEIGYIPNEFYIEESYLAFRDVPWVGEFRVGQYQAPMGLDVVTSSRDITFMEPAAPLQALAPGVNAGIQIGRPVLNQRATWRLGLFTDGVGEDFGDAARDYGRAIVRFTGLPVWQAPRQEPDTTRLLHLGLSANILYSASSSVRYRSRPESHLAPYVVDTGDIQAEGTLTVGFEAAWVNGPFSLQSEYLHSWVREVNGEVPGFDGVYASAGWFLSGESRRYDTTEGMFGRVMPRRNFDWGHGGWGAWELAARYSLVSLDSADVYGGRLSMVMAGVNWYLHPHVKWRFDYGFGRVSERQVQGNVNIFETRVEMDF